ncbi:hypothetical protein FIV42_12955 [Persicimonas caeni]|uniref:Uncharacterized protein n=1 Tax=Persicimonas caeni TaxID=2292766 RepID=A0A4Y6PTR1_PERCE|nr:hypothetical protein [Persicimonas caeni]QDG51623.1 hypothetical protein FIV42_12955 [Persicimonas caeni]QED32844.1 hypothetical protein FRD00_12950 [Persicimonas caeni]
MNNWAQKLTSPTFRHTAIGLYVVCLAALIGVYVWVSLLQVEYAAYIQGDQTFEKGRPNAMRGVVLDAPSGQFIRGAGIELTLVDGTYESDEKLDSLLALPSTGVAKARTAPSGHVHLKATVPEDWTAGEQALVVRADGSNVENFRTGSKIAVAERTAPVDYWPRRTERLPKDDGRRGTKTVASSEGPIQIELLPADGRVSRGLRSEVFLRTVDRETKEPVSVALVFEKAEGMRQGDLPKELRTDEMGLARLDIVAMTDQTWTLATKPEREGEEPSSAKLHVTTVPTQVALQMNEPLAVSGEPADGVVYSLFQSGGVMVDLYNGDDWVDAAAFGIRPDRSGVRAKVPALDEEGLLYRVQVYKSIYDAGGAWDIEYLVAAEGRGLDDYQQAAQKLADYVAERTDDPYFDAVAGSDVFVTTVDTAKLRLWIVAMLEAVPRHFDAPPLLINSQKAAREKLAAWKDDVKGDLMILTAIALLIGLAVVGYLVLMGVKSYQQQNQMLRDVELEMSLDEEGDEAYAQLDKSINEANWVAGLQIFIVVATLVFFTLGILLLLSYL